jgi:hypothetical protein
VSVSAIELVAAVETGMLADGDAPSLGGAPTEAAAPGPVVALSDTGLLAYGDGTVVSPVAPACRRGEDRLGKGVRVVRCGDEAATSAGSARARGETIAR